jgi:hypothetical protein
VVGTCSSRVNSSTSRALSTVVTLAVTSGRFRKSLVTAAAEAVSVTNLRELHGQLIAQSRRLTRALVAERLLNDFEFHTCPRCGAGVPERGDEHTCRLCLQTPPNLPAPSSLAAEQDRIIEQVTETEELIARSTQRLAQLRTAQLPRPTSG